jgi:hypothetical protein
MQIFDIGGRKLKTTSILERNSRVNLSDLEMGLYLVCFYSVDDELLFSRLLYKQ